MKLTFDGTFDNASLKSVTIHPTLPKSIPYSGYIETTGVSDFGMEPLFHMTIGDHILVNWTPQGEASFDHYGKYGGGNPLDNLTADLLPMELFYEAVGKSFAPSEIVAQSEEDQATEIALNAIPIGYCYRDECNLEVAKSAARNLAIEWALDAQSIDEVTGRVFESLCDGSNSEDDADKAMQIEFYAARVRMGITGGADKTWKLVDPSGVPIVEGDIRRSCEGDTRYVKGGEPPHKLSSTGCILVSESMKDTRLFAYFPSVYGAKWIDCNIRPIPNEDGDEANYRPLTL